MMNEGRWSWSLRSDDIMFADYISERMLRHPPDPEWVRPLVVQPKMGRFRKQAPGPYLADAAF